MNEKIRKAIKDNGLFQYEVAYECGVNEATFIRWLRKELDYEHKELILKAIAKLSKK